jgi:hypothetical protein
MHISTRKKIIIILTMAGMCSNRVMFVNLPNALFAVAKLNQTRQITERAHQIKTSIRTHLKNVFWPPAFFGGIGAPL